MQESKFYHHRSEAYVQSFVFFVATILTKISSFEYFNFSYKNSDISAFPLQNNEIALWYILIGCYL